MALTMAQHYHITVQEYLEDTWSTTFDSLTLTHTPNGATVLAGVIRDQTALYGLIAYIRDLGLTLVAVEKGVPPAEAAGGISDA